MSSISRSTKHLKRTRPLYQIDCRHLSFQQLSMSKRTLSPFVSAFWIRCFTARSLFAYIGLIQGAPSLHSSCKIAYCAVMVPRFQLPLSHKLVTSRIVSFKCLEAFCKQPSHPTRQHHGVCRFIASPNLRDKHLPTF